MPEHVTVYPPLVLMLQVMYALELLRFWSTTMM
jgi:hypothetical protein